MYAIPTVLPFGWRTVSRSFDNASFINDMLLLSVILSVSTENDGRSWLHVSCAHPDRLPSWETLKDVKTIFVGRDRQAVQVLPSEKNYVNVHPYCLHLFCCLEDEDPLPDFTRGRAIL
jgi:hypothetical protein